MKTKEKIDVIKNSYATLVQTLPINEIINPLYAEDVLTSTALKEIRSLPFSQSKTMYLLDNFILRSLKVGIDDYFDSLVEVLLESENLTAQRLGEQLQRGDVQVTKASPAVVKYDAKTAESAIRSIFVLLIDGLPIDSLMPSLIQKNVVNGHYKERMDQLTRTRKTAYLLNDIVIPSLKANVLKVFELLLEAMEEAEDITCQSLATELNSRLGKVKISIPEIIPPSDDNHLERYLTGSLPEGVSGYSAMERWIYAICMIKYDTIVKEESVGVTATGFVGSLTLKGINGGEPMVVLVTNNHVFQNLEQAKNASYQFGYQNDSGMWQPEIIKGKELIVDNKAFFFTHHQQDSYLKWLDYTVVRVYERRLKEAKFICKLDGMERSVFDCKFDLDKHVKPSPKAVDNEIVSVYHHPHSKVLQKSTQKSIECDYLLCYLCDTEEGSSGAPLVKTVGHGHRHVIALHRGWLKLKGNNYNFGTLMSSIVDHIEGKSPSFFGNEGDMVKKISDADISI